MTDDEAQRAKQYLIELLKTRGQPQSVNIGFPVEWTSIVAELDAKLVELDPDYELVQVKAKFGGLRYYLRHGDDVTRETADLMFEAVRQAEEAVAMLELKARGDRVAVKLLKRSVHGSMYVDFPYGWTWLLHQLDADMSEIDPDYQIVQVKEKFAGLRFYWNPGASEPMEGESDEAFDERIHTAERMSSYHRMSALVREAEQASYKTCTVCGWPGRWARRATGWEDTVCDRHMREGWKRLTGDEED